MLFSSSTDVYEGLGSTATGMFSDFKVYIFIIIGVVLAFYIIERIVIAVFPRKYYGDNIQKDV
jgi:hypothetical protein